MRLTQNERKNQMKKLVIMAAAMALGVSAQAATFQWQTAAQAYGPSVANLTPDASGNYACGTATSDRMRAEGNNQGVTWTYVMLLSDGTNNEQIDGTVTTYSSNKISETITTSTIALPSDDSAITISWDIVITGTKTTEAGTYTYVSNHIIGNGTYSKLSDALIASAAPSSWDVTVPSAPVIPEPTTGLLVLLGVAGLALRRRA